MLISPGSEAVFTPNKQMSFHGTNYLFAETTENSVSATVLVYWRLQETDLAKMSTPPSPLSPTALHRIMEKLSILLRKQACSLDLLKEMRTCCYSGAGLTVEGSTHARCHLQLGLWLLSSLAAAEMSCIVP